ncbi:hypothetical protein FKX85_20810 [Echinicola soli]|uniref:Uncharacterized protein n=1 Tax=Echinicola soli TaxID=2591634 RepID=A0A514CNJ3_9BACT|nr:hypothetical protein [Echinicola soli]QDH81337.1 hypothetical protein FKX85_20810 [Echinicola soli]
MKITPELFEKYLAGQCSRKEEPLVEQWLNNDSQELPPVSKALTSTMSASIWNRLDKNKKSRSTQDISLHQRIIRYAAVACFVLGSFYLGYLVKPETPPNSYQQVMAQAIDEMLYLSSSPESIKKISADKCELVFYGVVRIYNNSHVPKQVVCEGKTLTVSPGKVSYYLNTKTQGFRKITIRSGELLFYDKQLKNSPISICV